MKGRVGEWEIKNKRDKKRDPADLHGEELPTLPFIFPLESNI
jgi:hypothetical protein